MLAPQIVAKLNQRLTKLLEDCSVINAAVVTSADGHMCAMRQGNQQYPLERLATMGSTLMSLGDTITAELKMGSCDNIISENKHGIVTFMHINNDLVLVALTVHKNSLGMLLSYSRRCAEEMAQFC